MTAHQRLLRRKPDWASEIGGVEAAVDADFKPGVIDRESRARLILARQARNQVCRQDAVNPTTWRADLSVLIDAANPGIVAIAAISAVAAAV